MENIPDTPEGIILESLLEGMNQYYSAELSQKVKRGMYETRRKGYFQGGILPYGYKSEGRKIVVDLEQAEVVLFMYEQFSMGVCARVIINESSNGDFRFNIGLEWLTRNRKSTAVAVLFLFLSISLRGSEPRQAQGLGKASAQILEEMIPFCASRENRFPYGSPLPTSHRKASENFDG